MSEQQILSKLENIEARLSAPPPGRWLKLKEAMQYSCVGKAALLRLVAEGKVKACKDSDGKTAAWIFDRYSIDAWRESQCNASQTTARAQEILDSLK